MTRATPLTQFQPTEDERTTQESSTATKRAAMRVAVLATAVDFGGIEKVLLTLLGNMEQDVELVPIVFTRSDGRSRAFFDQLARLRTPTRTLFVDRSRLKYLNPIRNIVEAIGLLKHERVDLIHSHGYRADLIALVVSRVLGIPVVSTCHGFTPIDRRLAFYSGLNVLMLRRFTRVMAVSTRMRDDLVGQGIQSDRVVVVTNAIEPVAESARQIARHDVRSRLQIGEHEIVFGYVGRLSDEKGVEHLLSALACRAPEPPWRLLIVGDGPRRRDLEQAASRTGLAERITFAGFQSDASAWYAAMDLFVLPSLTEGTPMALLEAMIRRLPVVATAVGGVPAIVSNRSNGILVPAGNPQALSDALSELANDDALRVRLSNAGYETVHERYDVGTWVSRVRSVYQQALEGVPA